MNNRLRRIFITWNNYNKQFENREQVEQFFKELEHLKYYVIGFEKGESGTPHLQGVIGFEKAIYFSKLRKILKGAHIEKIINLEKAVEYCKKENDYIEHGEIIKERERTDIHDFRDAIIKGASNLELADVFPSQYFRYYKTIDMFRQDILNDHYSQTLRKDLKVYYIFGATGTGKTRYIYDNYDMKDIYRVSDYANPFDNYKGQKILVLDEYRSDFKLNVILNLLDIYPTELPARYNNKVACYERVYIISNWSLSSQYPNIQIESPESYNAFRRRIHGVVEIGHNEEENKKALYKVKNEMLEELF